MATKIQFTPSQTYVSEANADKAVAAKFGAADVRYIVLRDAGGRFFPVFVGPAAVQAGVHFHFNVVG